MSTRARHDEARACADRNLPWGRRLRFGPVYRAGAVPGGRAEYGSRMCAVSTLSKVPSDKGHNGPGQPHEIRRCQLELQAAPPG